MPKFLVSIHHDDDYDPSTEDAAMGRAIDDLNDAMVEAGIRIFVGGLHHASQARTIEGAAVLPGPRLPGREHAGGLWVLELPTMDEAVEWGKRASVACRAPVEVRQFH